METVQQMLDAKAGNGGPRGIVSIAPDASVYEGLRLMAEKEVGSLLVMEGARLAGIFSERDYARKVILKGKRVKGKKNTFRGKVRVKVAGRPDRKLPDGSAGVGLNRKSVPKPRKIGKKGKKVIKFRTRDKLGNKSKVTRVVVRIRR